MASCIESEMARVAVIGTSCVGKTTFAQALARVSSFPHVELDAFYWQPNWIPRPPEEFRALIAQALAQDCWVTDGNYGTVRDLIWSRATTIIWLNYAFSLVLWRAIKRTLRRALTQEELFSGNRESLRMAFFSRESTLWFVLTTFHRRRKQYRVLFDKRMTPQLIYVEFRNPNESENFLTRLENLAALGLTDDRLTVSTQQHPARWDLGTCP